MNRSHDLTGLLSDLSIPRAVGSPGERRVRDRIRRVLEDDGWQVREQPVRASTVPLRIAQPCAAALFGVLLTTATLVFDGHPAASAVIAAVVVSGLAMSAAMGWRLADRLFDWGNQLATCNLIANLRGKTTPPDTGRLVFMAHYDSKSQAVPLLVRGLAAIAAIACSSGVLLLSVGAALHPHGAWAAIAGPVGVAGGMAFFVLTLNQFANTSPGALDNASGVAVLVALGRRLGNSPAAAGITLVFTGAEEIGLAGALRFIQVRRPTAGPPLRVVNVDSVGAAGGICVVGKDEELRRQIARAGERIGLRIRPLRLALAVGLDHMPIARRGHPAVSIVGRLGLRELWAIHSPRDRPERVDPRALERVVDMLHDMAQDNPA